MSRLYKIITWRLISITATFILTWAMTGDMKEASGFTMILHVLLMSLHWGFEISWDKLTDEEG